jgi:hypothetical protein
LLASFAPGCALSSLPLRRAACALSNSLFFLTMKTVSPYGLYTISLRQRQVALLPPTSTLAFVNIPVSARDRDSHLGLDLHVARIAVDSGLIALSAPSKLLLPNASSVSVTFWPTQLAEILLRQ